MTISVRDFLVSTSLRLTSSSSDFHHGHDMVPLCIQQIDKENTLFTQPLNWQPTLSATKRQNDPSQTSQTSILCAMRLEDACSLASSLFRTVHGLDKQQKQQSVVISIIWCFLIHHRATQTGDRITGQKEGYLLFWFGIQHVAIQVRGKGRVRHQDSHPVHGTSLRQEPSFSV